MYGVKLVSMLTQELQRVSLVERERVSLLRRYIHARHVEARSVVAHASTTGTAEEVKQSRPVFAHCLTSQHCGALCGVGVAELRGCPPWHVGSPGRHVSADRTASVAVMPHLAFSPAL